MATPGAAQRASVVDRITSRAAEDADFVRVLELIADVPVRPLETVAAAARGINAARRRSLLDDFLAHALPTETARQILGLKRVQNLHTARQRGRLLALTVGNVTYFPAWQFDEGVIRSELPEIIEALGRYADDAVVADRVLRLPRDDLDGRSIADALDDPELASTAWIVLADSSR